MTPADLSREEAILARQRRLRERVAQYGLFLDGVASDGNCLFRAVSRQLYGTAEHHLLVRHRVVAQLSRDRSSYEPFFGEGPDFEQYLTEMATDSFWGDELAVRAVADVYSAEVHILTSAGTGFYILYTPVETAAATAMTEESGPSV